MLLLFFPSLNSCLLALALEHFASRLGGQEEPRLPGGEGRMFGTRKVIFKVQLLILTPGRRRSRGVGEDLRTAEAK